MSQELSQVPPRKLTLYLNICQNICRFSKWPAVSAKWMPVTSQFHSNSCKSCCLLSRGTWMTLVYLKYLISDSCASVLLLWHKYVIKTRFI